MQYMSMIPDAHVHTSQCVQPQMYAFTYIQGLGKCPYSRYTSICVYVHAHTRTHTHTYIHTYRRSSKIQIESETLSKIAPVAN